MTAKSRSSLLAASAGIAVLAMAPRASAEIGSGSEMSVGVRMTYENTPKLETNVPGVMTFPEPPAGFDPRAASALELARYGFPPKPDATLQPQSYRSWAKAMRASRSRSTSPIVVTAVKSMNMVRAPTRRNAAAIAGTTLADSLNWSGIVNTTSLQKYNATYSFSYVISDFNVPAAEQAFGACDGGDDWEVSWNGIDGFDNGDVLQGGSASEASCSGGAKSESYFAWFEWYPSYPIIEAFTVIPGDDLYVQTYDTSAKNGYVYLVDETTGVYNTYAISPKSGEPSLIGNSAEYIVERPCCSGSHFYPLANYVQDFWAEADAYTFKGGYFYPGLTNALTYLVTMEDDQGDDISAPVPMGKNGIFFEDEGCAYQGGCTP